MRVQLVLILLSAKLNLKCITKCCMEKTNNSNGTMYAITTKVLNQHDKFDDYE